MLYTKLGEGELGKENTEQCSQVKLNITHYIGKKGECINEEFTSKSISLSPDDSFTSLNLIRSYIYSR